MNERRSQRLTKLAGACLHLYFGLAICAWGSPPDNRLDYPSLMTQAISDVKRGQVEAGEARMREAVEQAEEAGDLARIYWESWQLARYRGPAWSLSHRLAWFDVAEDALKRRDRTHFKWRTADLPNYIQLLCEKETVLAAQGRRGLAFLACRQAVELLREHWGPMEDDEDLRRAPALHIGILLNLRLDQAEHLENAGRMEEAARIYERCLAVAETHLAGHADHAGYMSRAANNYAVMLGLIGQDEEEEKWQAEALSASRRQRRRSDCGGQPVAAREPHRGAQRPIGPASVGQGGPPGGDKSRRCLARGPAAGGIDPV
jgi:tetratricopeptide (TPR) repeat protein